MAYLKICQLFDEENGTSFLWVLCTDDGIPIAKAYVPRVTEQSAKSDAKRLMDLMPGLEFEA